jgi:hypothetical protein
MWQSLPDYKLYRTGDCPHQNSPLFLRFTLCTLKLKAQYGLFICGLLTVLPIFGIIIIGLIEHSPLKSKSTGV